MVPSQGFEPRLPGSEPGLLPLKDNGMVARAGIEPAPSVFQTDARTVQLSSVGGEEVDLNPYFPCGTLPVFKTGGLPLALPLHGGNDGSRTHWAFTPYALAVRCLAVRPHYLGGAGRIRTAGGGSANPCLAAWLQRRGALAGVRTRFPPIPRERTTSCTTGAGGFAGNRTLTSALRVRCSAA